MGGWNYTFSIGYQAELGPFLKKTPKGDKDYVLAVPFLTPIADVAIDEVEVKISLPEGARYDITRKLQISAPRLTDTVSNFSVTFPSILLSLSTTWTTRSSRTPTLIQRDDRPSYSGRLLAQTSTLETLL